MKVLYVGVYRDGTGWGQAAIDYILALDEAGVDVVPRALKLNDQQASLPDRILELEQREARGADVFIQHILPRDMEYHSGMLNVGMFASESDGIPSQWVDRLNNLDLAVVFNHQSATATRWSGVSRKVKVVPHAANMERFQRSYEPLEALRPAKEGGAFLFYWMGEFVRRKNLAATLKAFHLEFDPSEPVGLVIKTSAPHDAVVSFCDAIKRGLKLHGGDPRRYAREVILTERLSDEGVLRLHASCSCFVMPSYGEAWCIPAFDAMAMGKTPIVTKATGFIDYVSNAEGYLVDWHREPVFGVTDSLEDLHVGTESWAAVDIHHLRSCMREAFTHAAAREEKAKAGITRAYDFSYENVGRRLREVLEHEALDRGARPVRP